jgi:hypothetical protein
MSGVGIFCLGRVFAALHYYYIGFYETVVRGGPQAVSVEK